jgi:hypothetical protein
VKTRDVKEHAVFESDAFVHCPILLSVLAFESFPLLCWQLSQFHLFHRLNAFVTRLPEIENCPCKANQH